jgi:hypothetical protein
LTLKQNYTQLETRLKNGHVIKGKSRAMNCILHCMHHAAAVRRNDHEDRSLLCKSVSDDYASGMQSFFKSDLLSQSVRSARMVPRS